MNIDRFLDFIIDILLFFLYFNAKQTELGIFFYELCRQSERTSKGFKKM